MQIKFDASLLQRKAVALETGITTSETFDFLNPDLITAVPEALFLNFRLRRETKLGEC